MMFEDEITSDIPENSDAEKEKEKKPQKKEVKKMDQKKTAKKELPLAAAPPTKEDLDKAGAITITQFMRSEALGIAKHGFALFIRKKGVGGRLPRKEWMALFQEYRNTPVTPFKSERRRGM